VIVVAGRLFGQLVSEAGELPLGEKVWGDTMLGSVDLANGVQPFDVLSGRTVELQDGRLRMADLFSDFPAALLCYDCSPA
jgi:hypothetical protein